MITQSKTQLRANFGKLHQFATAVHDKSVESPIALLDRMPTSEGYWTVFGNPKSVLFKVVTESVWSWDGVMCPSPSLHLLQGEIPDPRP